MLPQFVQGFVLQLFGSSQGLVGLAGAFSDTIITFDTRVVIGDNATLNVLGLWWEDGVRPGVRRERRLDRELQALTRFVGADSFAILASND